MATVVQGKPGTKDWPFSYIPGESAVQVRDAQVTCAEAAIAGGWEGELGDVLEVLGDPVVDVTTQITPARKRALTVLLDAKLDDRLPLRISNETNAACVYWQSAVWLVENGLAESPDPEHITLTAAGLDIAWALR